MEVTEFLAMINRMKMKCLLDHKLRLVQLEKMCVSSNVDAVVMK